jgi:putative transposase
MCCLLGVSRSGFYKWLDVTPSPRAIRSETIKATVRRVLEASRGIYGSKKIAHELQKSTEVEKACRNIEAACSQSSQSGVPSCEAKPKVGCRQNLSASFQWVGLSCSSIELVQPHGGGLVREQITDAMRKAIEARRPSAGTLLHHSDRGCQYTSESFQDLLRTLQITCSMSRTGCCYDNAVAERFFWSLKHEWTKFESYENLDDAKISVSKYIETIYNPVRLHQTLEYQSPDPFERKQKMPLVA